MKFNICFKISIKINIKSRFITSMELSVDGETCGMPANLATNVALYGDN